MGNSVFVLGAGGFIGHALCADFAGRGWQVFAGTRQPVIFSHPEIRNAVAAFNGIEDFVPWVEQCSVIVHAASHTTPSSSAAQPQLDGNLRSTLALVEALQAIPGRKLIYLSSGGALYDERDEPVNEEVPLRPRSYHGAGKAAAEHFIQAWAAQCSGMACVLRPSNVYGPGQPPRSGFGIIPAAFDCVKRAVPLQIWGDGGNVRDYLYIRDLVALCAKVLDTQLPSGVQTFNVSSGQGVSLLELLMEIEKVTGQSIQRQHMPARAIDMRRIVPDNTRARLQFGWQPSTSLSAGLTQAWNWFKAVYA